MTPVWTWHPRSGPQTKNKIPTPSCLSVPHSFVLKQRGCSLSAGLPPLRACRLPRHAPPPHAQRRPRRAPVRHTCAARSLAVRPSPIAIAHAADPCHGRWGACAVAPQVFLGRAKGTHEHGGYWWCSCAAGSDPDRLNRSAQASPLLCCKVYFRCFSRFKGMLQLFLMDVAKVDRGCCICCKCFKCMLQAFFQNVWSIFRRMLQSFFIWMLHMYHTCVAKVCFSCFSLMLQ